MTSLTLFIVSFWFYNLSGCKQYDIMGLIYISLMRSDWAFFLMFTVHLYIFLGERSIIISSSSLKHFLLMKKVAKIVQNVPKISLTELYWNTFHYPWLIYPKKWTIINGIKLLVKQQALSMYSQIFPLKSFSFPNFNTR